MLPSNSGYIYKILGSCHHEATSGELNERRRWYFVFVLFEVVTPQDIWGGGAGAEARWAEFGRVYFR